MPTLYAAEGMRSKKPNTLELMLYNMASLLGGVAAGYDVRMSNVSPLHPRLQPYRAESTSESTYRTGSEGSPHLGSDYEFHTSSGYAHNTYHGPAKHYRPLLNTMTSSQMSGMQSEDQKPLRFTDSPQHYSNLSTLQPNMASTSSGFVGQTLSNTSGLGSNYTNTSSNLSSGSGLTQPPTPSPRRKSSSTSNEGDLYVNYRENFTTPERVPNIYAPSDYVNQDYTEPNNGPQYVGHFTSRGEMYRNEPYQPSQSSSFNYDRNHEYIPAKHRNPDAYSHVVYNEFGPNLQHNYDAYHGEYVYENPLQIQQNNRTPVRLPYNTHRRTNSNVSNASSTNTSSSNINQAFRLEGDDSGASGYPPHYYYRSQSADKYAAVQKTPEKREREYEFTQNKQGPIEYSWKVSEYSHTSHSREYYPRQNSQEGNPAAGNQERPGTLGLELGVPNKLRSSLKKYNQKKSGGGSGGGTPTNPTPPDSLTSEDSSYVSAKDSSGSGSRVRFSPETLVDQQHPQERRPSRQT